MKCVTIVLFAVIVYAKANVLSHIASQNNTNGHPRSYIYTMEQRIDHFNNMDMRKWEMRYYIDRSNYKTGGPILINLGGTETLHDTPFWGGGLFQDMAREYNAYMFFPEHRYYGQSIPVEDLTLENLKYLSAIQELADIANFIQQMKVDIPSLVNSKVILVGQGYGANLATWAKIKYPHLVDAVVASGAPLKSVQNFSEFFEITTNNIANISGECMNSIRKGLNVIEPLLEIEAGRKLLAEMFNLCNPIQNINQHIKYFMYTVFDILSKIGDSPSPDMISWTCDRLLRNGEVGLENVAIFYTSQSQNCIPDYKRFLELLRNTELPEKEISVKRDRQWFYQLCTEFGQFHTTSISSEYFQSDLVDLPFYEKLCEDIFDKTINRKVLLAGIANSNTEYGSDTPKVNKVVFTQSTLDPLRVLGLNEALSEDAPVLITAGYGEELVEAKLKIREIIKSWIEE